MSEQRFVIFVCEHGAAKSIVAAAYFNQLANISGLNIRAIGRGINPEDELSQRAVSGLAQDGLTPSESSPQELSLEEVHDAQRVVSFCELPSEFTEATIVEQWNDIPPVSQDYDKARDAILENMHDLLNRIRSTP